MLKMLILIISVLVVFLFVWAAMWVIYYRARKEYWAQMFNAFATAFDDVTADVLKRTQELLKQAKG